MAHRYLHSLPRKQEEIINNMLREYKYSVVMGFLTPTDIGLDIDLQKLNFEIDKDLEDCITIPLEETTKEDIDKLHKLNRAKIKRETQKQIEDELYSYYNMEEDDDFDR